jgi:hypothetical protein
MERDQIQSWQNREVPQDWVKHASADLWARMLELKSLSVWLTEMFDEFKALFAWRGTTGLAQTPRLQPSRSLSLKKSLSLRTP